MIAMLLRCVNDSVVRHLPRSISQVSWFFLLRAGSISCEVTGLEYMAGLLFEGRGLFLNPSKPPRLIFEAGVYSEGFLFKEIRYMD